MTNFKPDVVIRWGNTFKIPEGNYKVLNKSEAISRVNDKAGFRRRLMQEMPDRVPRTWFNPYDPDITYPCIVRPRHHAQGKKLWVPKCIDDLIMACRMAGDQFYISELIEKSAEFRVYVVNGRVACVAEKIPDDPNKVAWNAAQGGEFRNVRWDNWPIAACKAACKAWQYSGLDFAGVDVMLSKAGLPYIIELNSAPSLPLREKGDKAGGPTYRHEAMGKALIHTATADKPFTCAAGDNWRDVIHPALNHNANA